MKILNLTQHVASAEQIEAGVIEPANKSKVQSLLTFNSVPNRRDIIESARRLSMLAQREGADRAMIGGAPFLMSALENALLALHIEPVYAFSVRESVEKEVNGEIVKTSTFKHKGFVGVTSEHEVKYSGAKEFLQEYFNKFIKGV